MHLCLRVENAGGTVLAERREDREAALVYEEEYQPGDVLVVECEEAGCHLELGLDDAISAAPVYLRDRVFRFPVPFAEERAGYSPRAFQGQRHLLTARQLDPWENGLRRNLARNPWDRAGNEGAFPHIAANAETRGEAAFAARNAIDGLRANRGHGAWPYTSWGINRDPRARLRLDFGRPVRLDEVVLYLRADFPHDAWWERATIGFSDGARLEVPLIKTGAGQRFPFSPKVVEWLTLGELIRAADPSPFPALTQIEAYGMDCVKK